jgi:hypothetical protein
MSAGGSAVGQVLCPFKTISISCHHVPASSGWAVITSPPAPAGPSSRPRQLRRGRHHVPASSGGAVWPRAVHLRPRAARPCGCSSTSSSESVSHGDSGDGCPEAGVSPSALPP